MHLTVFYLTLLFVHFGLSTPIIDYGAIKKNICNELEGCGNNDTKKVEFLINRAINLEIQLHNWNESNVKLEAKVDNANQEIGTLKRDKNILADYVKKLQCPTNIRHRIEAFSTRYGITDSSLTRRKEVHTHIKHKLDDVDKIAEYSYVQNFVRQLSTLHRKPDNQQKFEFEKAWERLQEEVISFSQPGEASQLSRMLFELNQAKDLTEALKLWEEQKESFWKHREQTFSQLELNTIREMCQPSGDELFETLSTTSTSLNLNEIEKRYVHDILKIGKVMKPGTSAKYELCMWVIYISSRQDMIDLWKIIDKKWSSLPRWDRANLYCEEFDVLYNSVSKLKESHAGGDPPVIKECEVGDEDFERYIKILTAIHSERVAFVARSLYTNNST